MAGLVYFTITVVLRIKTLLKMLHPKETKNLSSPSLKSTRVCWVAYYPRSHAQSCVCWLPAAMPCKTAMDASLILAVVHAPIASVIR
eukprot:1862589-Amphidinium_carterae.1